MSPGPLASPGRAGAGLTCSPRRSSWCCRFCCCWLWAPPRSCISDRAVVWFGPEHAQWLTFGHLIVPLTFFAIALTNRRYGAGYAMAQIRAGLGGCCRSGRLCARGPGRGGGPRSLPPIGELMAVGGGVVRRADHLRAGLRPHARPALVDGAVPCGALGRDRVLPDRVPGAYVGTTIDWFGRLVLYAGIMAASAIALLVPYWLLRRMVPPLSGFGGY